MNKITYKDIFENVLIIVVFVTEARKSQVTEEIFKEVHCNWYFS